MRQNFNGYYIANFFGIWMVQCFTPLSCNSKAKSAAIVYHYDNNDNDLTVTWTANQQGAGPVVHNFQDTVNVGMAIEEIMSNENNNYISLK